MNEREKIIEIIRKRLTELSGSCQTDDIPLDKKSAEIVKGFAYELADALIANGIGDVAERKKRAEVAERNDKIKDRALKIAATRLKCYGGWGKGFCAVSDCEYRNCGNDEGCVLAHLRKAEREIEEEKIK